MAFRLRTAVTDGLRLTFSRNGAVFVGLNACAQLVSLLLVAVAATRQLPVSTGVGLDPVAGVPIGQSIPTPVTALTVGLTTVFTAIVTTPITIITIRTFVDGVTDHIPDVHLFGHLGRATARGLIASLLIGVIILVAFILSFVVPLALVAGIMAAVGALSFLPDLIGIIGAVFVSSASFFGMLVVGLLLYIHLMFVLHEISVRNRPVVDSLRGSWDIARGHRLKLGGLAVGLIAVQSAVSSVGTPNQLSDPNTAQAFMSSVPQLLFLPVGLVFTAFVTTLSAAVIARAYAEITAVDAVGGQRSDLDSGDDPTDSETGTDAEATPDTDAEPAA
ncbi:MAG: hypothetical protein A07HN63_00118 [uncultured archaeon A07HN63]|nr:MAG: hypothetical protein A07HN63_00118 [uncultured archaeon A07HN63]